MMGLRMKNFNILEAHWKIHNKPIYKGGLPKKRGLGEFTDLRETLAKKRGGGGDIPMHTMCLSSMILFCLNYSYYLKYGSTFWLI